MQPQTLDDWLVYIDQLLPKPVPCSLERVNTVKQALGLAPQFPIIVVGGTNGKGSTCAFLEAMLTSDGHHVGCYTSPHLLRYNERVRFDRREASDEALCQAFAAVEQARGETPLSYFEFGTLAAMVLFEQVGVDIAILEVGLGGRLDAVNAFDSDCAIITSIEIDHVETLGDTREAIGLEKAGIFRTGKPAVCAEPRVPISLFQYARDLGTHFIQVGWEFSYNANELRWTYNGTGGISRVLPLPTLYGPYQLSNASAAIAALDQIRDRLAVSDQAIQRGLLSAGLIGRFQVLQRHPTLILDVAHNPHAAAALAENLTTLGTSHHTIAVFAILNDKDIRGVVRAVRQPIDQWLVADLREPRGSTAADLKQILESEGIVGEILTFENPAAAYIHACKIADPTEDRVVVFGSFHTVAEVVHHGERLRAGANGDNALAATEAVAPSSDRPRPLSRI
ncbi:MAG: bifunctional tetrahydrofolate synthase/dihydrofolate synthase [Gammaproteobacteria bacterium]|nr:bifunctional tetrahydrofolate synthase/dihydrofolate synthase [Gammaproteobacteria bacterium]